LSQPFRSTNSSKGESTRQAILEHAAPLFNQRGFEGCSITDIMAATGLQKGGIYRHFSSKEELAEAAFRHSLKLTLRRRRGDLTQARTPLDKLRLLVEHFVHTPTAVAGGCPLLNTAVDTDDGNPALRTLVRRAFRAWRRRISSLAQQAIDAHELRPDTDVLWLANTVISTLEGAVMLSRLERSKTPLLHAQQTLNLLLDTLASKRR
jgi:TetR/AcrR family transcriptional regulator, transcriptional repressor for nem operon